MTVSFAERLRKLRTEKGLSQQQLAMKMLVDRSSIARWENGTRSPDILLMPRLAECLSVDVSDLLDDDGSKRTKARPLPALTRAQRAVALERRGRANYRAYRFEDAERDFTAVAEIDPSRAGAMRFFSALCRYGAGRDDEAYASARALLAETPDSPLRADLLLWLGKFDFAQRNYGAAFAAFEACATNRHVSTGRRLDALVRAARWAKSNFPNQRSRSARNGESGVSSKSARAEA